MGRTPDPTWGEGPGDDASIGANFTFTFNASNLKQGTYFVRMTTEGFTATKNMNIVK